MHDGMTLDTIEGQGQGHSKVEKSANFNIISAIYYPISLLPGFRLYVEPKDMTTSKPY